MSTNDRIERDVYIAADAARVWAVLTQPQHVGTWFGNGDPAEVDLRPGGRIVFDHGDHGKLPAVIEQVDEPKSFSFRWAADDADSREPTEANATLVEFTLTPEREGTRLRVVESGFARVEADPSVIERRYKANAGGWGEAVRGLAVYAEQPEDDDALEEVDSI
ncbi:SRPBCC family protein [Actinospica durhamensis]|uniref:SRPBCC family protein n=1 Tax=Actinospica durhamensis TaxID=1508375 RepID=A0A941F1P0_9ACTN|nr:SRPBCC family protein [Actinospica durhamensis]MBR7839599.1 SRPBCC family protein [Actinospica durhamensis]